MSVKHIGTINEGVCGQASIICTKVGSVKRQKIRGERRYRGYLLYKNSPDFTPIKVRNTLEVGDVGYRAMADDYLCAVFYQKPRVPRQHGRKTLVISAHGGYFDSDLALNPMAGYRDE
ncbi:MAG: hypothetical protein ACR5LD_02720 [Symbiopectobacterium sp.]